MTFPDSKLENTSTYKFNQVFNGFRELQNAFEKSYSPIIKNTLNGENSMLIFGGLPITESMDFFTSMNGRVGLINQSAQLLLKSNNISTSNSNMTVTLSWFQITNNETEDIVDLLRMSSSLHSTEKNDNKDNLLLRELGKGRGMTVPGLWEVEVTKPQDVDAVIAHVQRMLPEAKHDGKCHTIFQLTVSPNENFIDEKKSKMKDDAVNVGRLTFVLLSNVCSPSSSPSEGSSLHLELYSWVKNLEDILKWIDNKRPSPPFHKSRALLFLRDALCTRMTCGITLFLQPTVEALSENAIWLELLSHISSTNASRLAAINTLPIHSSVSVGPMLAASTMTKEQAFLHNASHSKQSTPTSSGNGLKSKQRFNSSTNTAPSSGRKGILKKSSTAANSQRPQGQQSASKSAMSRKKNQMRNSNEDFLHQLPPDDMSAPHEDMYGDDVHSRDFDRHSRGSKNMPPPTPSADEVQQHKLLQQQLQYQREFYEKQQQMKARSGIASRGQQRHQQQQQPQELLSPPPPPPYTQISENKRPPYQTQEFQYDNSLLPPQMQSQNQYENEENMRPNNNSANRDEDDRKEAETVEALLVSLQSSRDEVESLKKSLLLCQQSLEYHKAEHEALKNAKEAVGSTLKAKDRERFKKALQELKDYEVYREVMEAAMSRMQNEIDKLEGENISFKQATGQLEKELRKSKNITHKITRETADFEKSKASLHERVSTAEKDARRLTRERDAAVLALSQYKAEKARDEEDLKSSRRLKHREVLDLKKKLADANMQIKMQTEESERSAELHAQEMKKLQTAHKKSLEMLMACQEENDLLRSAVAELEEEKTKVVSTLKDRHASSDNKRSTATTPSPLSNVFKTEGGTEDDTSSVLGKNSKEDENSPRRKTIVFVDDYENGDVYIEGDESSILTGDTESLSSNIEIAQKLIQPNSGMEKSRIKNISFAKDNTAIEK